MKQPEGSMLPNDDEVQGRMEYLYNRLPPKKRVFVDMMIKTFGNVQQSCMACGIKSRMTYYEWKKKDPEFSELMDGCEFEEMLLDFAESKLIKNIDKGDVASTIFFLKTKGQKRGYVEKVQLSGKIKSDSRPSWFDDQKPLQDGTIEDAVVVSETKTNSL